MTYSYTQISQYLTCPRRYRHRYLDGWQEKDTRAAMLFGRAFEQALAAYFLREDAAAVLFREWTRLQGPAASLLKERQLGPDAAARHSTSGPLLPGRPHPHSPAPPEPADQVHPARSPRTTTLSPTSMPSEQLDGTRCLIEWKTTSARYPEEPDGLLALDPQLVCYSWMTGISEVAQVVFVRKRLVEVQYLRTTITDQQRNEFGHLVADTIGRIESAQFLPHSGIRFPQNPCSTCPYLGLCLGKQEMVDTRLVRRPGAESLGWLDELTY